MLVLFSIRVAVLCLGKSCSFGLQCICVGRFRILGGGGGGGGGGGQGLEYWGAKGAQFPAGT